MVKAPQKMTKLVVSAIRSLREVQGSTAKDILNYVTRECNSDPAIERKLAAALKRGIEYGILKNNRGYFSLNTDPEMTDSGLVDAGRRRRRRRRRGGKSKSRGKGRGRRRRRRGGRRSRGRSRGGKRSRRGRSRHGKRRGSRMKSRGNIDDIDVLSKEPLDSAALNPATDFERPRSQSRSRHSRSRTPSRSRSSIASDREGAESNRHAG